MQLSNYPIESLIPQRKPIVMVDQVVGHSKTGIVTEFEILDSNYFVEDGVFTESGLLENIAQTAACKVGLECKLASKKVPLGFIGSINRVKISKLPEPTDILTTEVEILQEIFNISLISGKCFLNGDLLLECHMKIVIDP